MIKCVKLIQLPQPVAFSLSPGFVVVTGSALDDGNELLEVSQRVLGFSGILTEVRRSYSLGRMVIEEAPNEFDKKLPDLHDLWPRIRVHHHQSPQFDKRRQERRLPINLFVVVIRVNSSRSNKNKSGMFNNKSSLGSSSTY